jgi:hypothetical protein
LAEGPLPHVRAPAPRAWRRGSCVPARRGSMTNAETGRRAASTTSASGTSKGQFWDFDSDPQVRRRLPHLAELYLPPRWIRHRSGRRRLVQCAPSEPKDRQLPSAFASLESVRDDSRRLQPQFNRRAIHRSRGSSASRSPSPSKLNESTVRKIASPGHTAIHGAPTIKRCAALSMLPQDGAGGC